ncbi:nuclease HARBI1, partial [Phenoliferia sp. Uapishka_3]
MVRLNEKQRRIRDRSDRAIADFLEGTDHAAAEFEDALARFSEQVAVFLVAEATGEQQELDFPDFSVLLEALEDCQLKEDEACELFDAAREEVDEMMGRRYADPTRPGKIPKMSQIPLQFQYVNAGYDKLWKENFGMGHAATMKLVDIVSEDPVIANRRKGAPPQTLVLVWLWRARLYGNGGSVFKTAQWAGISSGAVVAYSRLVVDALCRRTKDFVTYPTPEERLRAAQYQWIKVPVDGWQYGIIMIDGTTVNFDSRPGFDGNSYFDRKFEYSMNLQVVNLPETLRIVDFNVGYTGSANDQSVFKTMPLAKNPEKFLNPKEFILTDSAYSVTKYTLGPYKGRAAEVGINTRANAAISSLRVESEHAIEYLKGRFGSLSGLRMRMTRRRHHREAAKWISACITAHNIAIPFEGHAVILELREEQQAREDALEREQRLRATAPRHNDPDRPPEEIEDATVTTDEGTQFRNMLRDRLIAFEDELEMRVGRTHDGVLRMPRNWLGEDMPWEV